MTVEMYSQLTEQLVANGYRKWNGSISNEDYYWCKGFGYYYDEDGDRRCSYQVLFQVWDNQKYKQMPNNAQFGIAVTILISHNHRTDLLISRETYDIKEVETKAQSFYDWAKQNLEL